MESRSALIALNTIEGIGSVSVRRLLEAFGSAEAVLSARPADLRAVLGPRIEAQVADTIAQIPAEEVAQREMRFAQEASIKILTLSDSDYPARLREIPDPPPVLYVKGALLKEDAAAVALVGTRAATPYGLAAARHFGERLARAGVTVVSGLAEGIDGAGHAGALAGAGRTIAVLGHGLNFLYPPHHRKLANQILEQGALVSEFPFRTPPSRGTFPRRNRVISGLSLGVVVVEAPPASGALITAREALEQGRDVFAVPGQISSHQSQGANALLRSGAILAQELEDILNELAPQLRGLLTDWRAEDPEHQTPEGPLVPGARVLDTDASGLTGEESAIFNAITVGGVTPVDALSRITGLAPQALLPILTGLELKRRVRQVVGRGFSRVYTSGGA